MEAIRSDVLRLRDEHLRAAADVQQSLAAKAIATSAASRVKPVRPSDPSLDFADPENVSIPLTFSSHVSPPSAPEPPSLPTMALITEPPPSEKLIHEQSIIIRAQAITRKNAELARERLPKQPEAQRNKTWRDYFLDEVVWMATDFREERKWKLQFAKKVAKTVSIYHQQKAQRIARHRLEQHHRTVRHANAVARDVRKFWSQIREIADFRLSRAERARRIQQSQIDLNKFLERTQRLSKELALGLQHPQSVLSEPSQSHSKGQLSLQSRSQSPHHLANPGGDAQVKQVRFADPPRLDPSSQQSEKYVTPHPNPVSRSPEKGSTSVAVSNGTGDGIESSVVVQTAVGNRCESALDSSSGVEPAKTDCIVPNGIVSTTPGLNVSNEPMSLVIQKPSPPHNELSAQGNGHIQSQPQSNGPQRPISSSQCSNASANPSPSQTPPRDIPESIVRVSDSRDRDRPHVNDSSVCDVGNDTTRLVRTPADLLRGTLRDYQLSGMQWLVNLYRNNSNGILADEMGLGKTIQTISLLAWLAIEQHQWGPHLIIVPTSVMVNWEVEFKRWLPGFKILTYFGNTKERKLKRKGWTDPELFHVCITSYTLAVQDIHILRRRKWFYLILDEAHNIKNFRSQRWQTLLTLSSQRRLLLTGTPLQNSVMELWSLMHFLMPSLFESQTEFKDWFSNPLQDSPESVDEHLKVVNQLHTVLRPFVLRRLKADVEKGLPPKFEHILKCRLSKRQRELYEDFLSRSEVRENLDSGDMFKVMNVMMQLRKVCNHPDLFEGRPILSPFAMNPLFYPVPACVNSLLSNSAWNCLNLGLMNIDICTRELTWPGHWHTAEEETISVEHVAPTAIQEQLSPGENLLPQESVRLDNAGLRRKERTLAFRRSTLFHLAVVSAHRIREKGLLGEDVRSACAMTPASLVESIRLNSSFRSDFIPHTTPDLIPSIERISFRATEVSELFVCCITKASAPTVELRYQGDDREYCQWQDDFLFLNRISSDYRSLFRSYEVRSQVTIPDKRLVQWDCGKLQLLDGLLRDLQHRGSRVLIFTQMTKMLDVLESFLNLHTFRYLRLDGATKTDDRQKVVHRFNTDMKIFCMILTTRAGGVGLNLTGADSVIFYDTDYNPAIDNQAQDRAHRIGQTRPVNVYRLISEQTVEEGILARAKQKQRLETKIISEAGFTTEAIVGHGIDSVTINRQRAISVSNEAPAAKCPNATGTQDDHTFRVSPNSDHLDGLESAQGNFRGFSYPTSVDSTASALNTLTLPGRDALSGVDEFQDVTDKVASDDDRDRLDVDSAAEEERLLEAEFQDEDDRDDNCPSDSALNARLSAEEPDVKSILSPVQIFALMFVEAVSSDANDVEASVSKSIEHGIVSEDEIVSKNDDRIGLNAPSPGTVLPRDDNPSTDISGASAHGDRDHDGASNEENLNSPTENDVAGADDNLFYELDITEEGRMNYLKALTDTDVNIKLYLPLRDGGPEELKISSVVCGTAAAGLECAEDAAFFPHAYNRMSRTQFATRRQKEKSLAIIRKRMADKESRKYSSDTSAPVVGGVISKDKALVSRAAHDSKRKESNINNGPGMLRRADGNCAGNVSIDLQRDSDRKNVMPVTASNGGSHVGTGIRDLPKLSQNISANAGSKGLSAGERSKFQKQKSESIRGNGTVGKKVRNNSIEAGLHSGLFKKSTKKMSRKIALNNLKLSSTAVLNGVIGCPGNNDGWTKEEDEHLISLSDHFANNMSLVADALAADTKVATGIRQRRTAAQCTQRLCKLAAKDKSSQILSPLAEGKDSDARKKHISALLSTFPHQVYVYTTGQASEVTEGDIHATQRKVIADARANGRSDLTEKGVLLNLANVMKGVKPSQSHRLGTKPRDGMQLASQRRKRPFLQPIKDDPTLSKSSFATNQYGSGMQVNGSGSGVLGVETGEVVSSRPSGFALQKPTSGPVNVADGRAEQGNVRLGSMNVGALDGGYSQNVIAGTGRGRGLSSSGVRNTVPGRLATPKVGASLSMSNPSGKPNNSFPSSKRILLASGVIHNRAGVDLNMKGPVGGNLRKDLKKTATTAKSSAVAGRSANAITSATGRVGMVGGVNNGVTRPASLKGSVGRESSAINAKATTNRVVAGKQKAGPTVTPGSRGRINFVGAGPGLLRGNKVVESAFGSKANLGTVKVANGLSKQTSGNKVSIGPNRGVRGAVVTPGDINVRGDAKTGAEGSAIENTKSVGVVGRVAATCLTSTEVATVAPSGKASVGTKASSSATSGSKPTETRTVIPAVVPVAPVGGGKSQITKETEGGSPNGYAASNEVVVPKASNGVPNVSGSRSTIGADETMVKGDARNGVSEAIRSGAVSANQGGRASKEASKVEAKSNSNIGGVTGENATKMSKEVEQVATDNCESGNALEAKDAEDRNEGKTR